MIPLNLVNYCELVMFLVVTGTGWFRHPVPTSPKGPKGAGQNVAKCICTMPTIKLLYIPLDPWQAALALTWIFWSRSLGAIPMDL